MKRDARAHLETKGTRLARRSFLKAVGSAAAALPFYAMLENSFAHAAGGSLPLKFLGVGGLHGTSEKFWARQSGEVLDADLSYDKFDISYFDSPLRPFDEATRYGYSFKKQINIFEGFDYGVGYNAAIPYGINCHGASAIFLTGSGVTDSDYAAMGHVLYNASLDQYLAGLYGGQTKFRSLEVATDTLAYTFSGSAIAVGAGGAILNTMSSPTAIWDKFFAGLMPMSDPAAARKRAVGKSILDYATGDLQRLQGRLAGTEKQKLDQHLTVIRDLEKRISTLPDVAMCTPPPRRAPSGNANPADDYVVGNPYDGGLFHMDRVADLQMELLAEILICDLTRFATIALPVFPGTPGGPLIPRPGDGVRVPAAVGADIDFPIPANFHLDIAHVYDIGTLENHRASAAVSRYYHSKVARLMARLQGAGVLDNTLILIGNEGSTAGHRIVNVPLVMAGGANGAIRMGRRIVAPGRTARVGDCPVPTADPTQPIGWGTSTPPTSHIPILVAVANAFHKAAGAPEIDRFGTCVANPEMTRGVSGLI